MCAFQVVESWDWSGAGTRQAVQPGIARATWTSVHNHYVLAAGFSRDGVFAILQHHAVAASAHTETAVAFDFPFSFPFQATGNIFIDGSLDWLNFAETVHQTVLPDGAAQQFYGGPATYGQGGFADHFAHWYLPGLPVAAKTGPLFINPPAHRTTETQAQAAGCPAASVFKLVNPMVGVQALAGISMLKSLLDWCIVQHLPLTIWPLGHLSRDGVWTLGTEDWGWEDHGLLIIESYPRVCYQRAGIAVPANFGNVQTVNQAIAALGVIPASIANHAVPTTRDQGDALIALIHLLSPAWFRSQVRPDWPAGTVHLAGQHGPPPPIAGAIGPGVPMPLRQIEGNIFGV